MPLAGILVQYTGWPSVFYVYGERPLLFLNIITEKQWGVFIHTLNTAHSQPKLRGRALLQKPTCC